jgi:hypothetical protein
MDFLNRQIRVWESLVIRLRREQENAGSNPAALTEPAVEE